MLGVAESGVAEQRVDSGQPRVAGARAVVPVVAQVFQEGSDEVGVEVVQVQLAGCGAGAGLGEGQQQAEGVPVGGHGVAADLALGDQPVGEEGLQDRGEGGHGVPPVRGLQASCRQGEQLGRAGQVPVRGGRGDVPEVGRQGGQAGLHVLAVAVPAEQGLDREGVTQAVDGRAGPRSALADPCLAEQVAEGRLHGGLAQPRPGRGHQEAAVAGAGHSWSRSAW